jgi:hypothetical protein
MVRELERDLGQRRVRATREVKTTGRVWKAKGVRRTIKIIIIIIRRVEGKRR